MTSSPLGIDVKASLRELKDGLKWAAGFAGAPVELARLGRIGKAAAAALRSWLGKLERQADLLLTAIAAELAPAAPLAAPDKAPAGLFARLAKTSSGADLSGDDSRRWRGIRYACVFGDPSPFAGPRRHGRRGRRGGAADPSAHEAADGVPTAALARRLEALIRIAEAPRRFARRLLRRNARRAERARRKPASRSLVAHKPAWLRTKPPPPRIRWIDTG